MFYGYPYGGFNTGYLLLIIICTAIGLGAQAYIKRTYARWSKVPAQMGETGAQVAPDMLHAQGVTNVGIVPVAGELTDHYDPRDNNLHLSRENLTGGSVASVAVACHEAGHALQRATGYVPMRMRSALVPVVNAASSMWILVFFAGIILNVAGLTTFAIILYACTVLFQLVTLPVEIDASRRAVAYISNRCGFDRTAEEGARSVLIAAALTYVAAALVSVLQLLYLLSRSRND